jgi:hypothetical protein
MGFDGILLLQLCFYVAVRRPDKLAEEEWEDNMEICANGLHTRCYCHGLNFVFGMYNEVLLCHSG